MTEAAIDINESSPAVIYSCPFIPAEWIAAHGFRPSRIQPRALSERSMRTGFCPYAQSFTESVIESSGSAVAIFTTTCDQMRRALEFAERDGSAPVFLFHVPTTWQSPAAYRLYTDELRRLGRFLVRQGGSQPTTESLCEMIERYDRARAALRDVQGCVSARRFSECIADFHRDSRFSTGGAKSHSSNGRPIPIALLGGPLCRDHLDLFDRVESLGGRIVLDATTTGERTLPEPIDRRELSRDPLQALATAYFGSIPDAFRRPNSMLYRWLRERIAEREIRGILFVHYPWCDTWHAEVRRMREWESLPQLKLVLDHETGLAGHSRSRIEAFLEIMK